MKKLIYALALVLLSNAALAQPAIINPGCLSGTSGAKCPLLNVANTWSALQTFNAAQGASAATPALALFDTTKNTNSALFWFSAPISTGPDLNLGVASNVKPDRFIINSTLRLAAAVEFASTSGGFNPSMGGLTFGPTGVSTFNVQTQVNNTNVITTGYNQDTYIRAYGGANGNNTNILGGVPTGGTGGNVNITAAAGVSGTSAGGSVVITSGLAAGAGTNGTIQLVNLTTGTNADFLCLSAGNVILVQTSACTISSMRFKNNITPLEAGAVATIEKLNPVAFNMKEDQPNADPNYAKRQIGLTAENVAEVDPRLAIYENDGVTPKSYRQESIIAVLIAAVKEQQREIDALKKGR